MHVSASPGEAGDGNQSPSTRGGHPKRSAGVNQLKSVTGSGQPLTQDG
jgi:hypothetical protein